MLQNNSLQPDRIWFFYGAGGLLTLQYAPHATRRLRAQPDASAYLQAVVQAALGRRDEAFTLLSRAVDRREDGVPDIGVDPSLDTLRDDPRMEALLRRVGLRTSAPGG